MNFYRKDKWYISGFGIAIIVILSILLLPFILRLLPFFSELSYSEILGTQQLYFSAVAFSVIWITLLLTMRLFRKSMAKPLIKVSFNKNGEQQATLIYKDGKLTTHLPPLWLINKGNAVARYFQIDFIIPENIGKQSRYKPIARDDGKYILPHTNDGKYTLFVNQPLDSGIGLSVAIDTEKCAKADEDSFEIKYRIYGDWAETQEGKLKVNITKQ